MFKKILITITVIYFLAAAQALWSMHEYADNYSVTCLGECSLLSDALLYAMINIILFMFVIAPISILLSKRHFHFSVKMFMSILLFIIYAFSIDYSIYDDREASWSTFTNIELLITVYFESRVEIATAALVLFFYLKFYAFKK